LPKQIAHGCSFHKENNREVDEGVLEIKTTTSGKLDGKRQDK